MVFNPGPIDSPFSTWRGQTTFQNSLPPANAADLRALAASGESIAALAPNAANSEPAGSTFAPILLILGGLYLFSKK